MRVEVPELRRRAVGLSRAGLYPYAERALLTWRAAAEAQEAWGSAAEAAMRSVGLALDRDQPSMALAIGAEALPNVLGRRRVDGDVKARLYIFLAKAAWGLGREAEMRAFVDAARCTAECEPVDLLVRVHLGLTASAAAMDDGQLLEATSWALQALDVAEEVADEGTLLLCRENLSHLWTQRGDFDRAAATIGDALTAVGSDVDLINPLINGVHIALGQGDLARAGHLASRAVAAYCQAPSQLSPTGVGYLFEAVACHQAACGAVGAAELLGATSRSWFAVRHRRRDVLRLERWLEDLARRGQGAALGTAHVDPDLLYLGDLFAAAYKTAGGDLARAVALSVNRLLREVSSAAAAAPCEHAAMLRPLAAGERWFTGRSAMGQAAERILAGADVAGKAALELLGAYERLGEGGASWRESLRILRREGRDPDGVAALDRLYRTATA